MEILSCKFIFIFFISPREKWLLCLQKIKMFILFGAIIPCNYWIQFIIIILRSKLRIISKRSICYCSIIDLFYIVLCSSFLKNKTVRTINYFFNIMQIAINFQKLSFFTWQLGISFLYSLKLIQFFNLFNLKNKKNRKQNRASENDLRVLRK